MSILHLVRTSAYQNDDLAQCLQVCAPTDSIILLDEGCYNLTHPLLSNISASILAVEEHCTARAVNCSAQQQITIKDLTPLFFSHNSVITWQ